MSTHNPANLDRLMDLLAARAVEGLDAPERVELDRLLRDHPEIGAGDLERAAALVWMGRHAPAERVPEDLRDRILSASASIPPEPGGLPRRATDGLAPILFWRRTASLGWLVAAACLALAVIGWWPRLFPPHIPTPVERRDALLREAPDARVLVLQAQAGAPAGFQGDVVWSESRREGYLRLRGLVANDPAQQRYQAWIFDPTLPSESPPVGAGVFDALATGGEVVIALDPNIGVGGAAAFGVTVERPGGAVVPTLSRLVALGQGQP